MVAVLQRRPRMPIVGIRIGIVPWNLLPKAEGTFRAQSGHKRGILRFRSGKNSRKRLCTHRFTLQAHPTRSSIVPRGEDSAFSRAQMLMRTTTATYLIQPGGSVRSIQIIKAAQPVRSVQPVWLRLATPQGKHENDRSRIDRLVLCQRSGVCANHALSCPRSSACGYYAECHL